MAFNSSLLTTTRPAIVDSCTNIKFIISLLNSTIPLLWLIVGTVTNGLSLIVFSRKSMKRNSTFFYLAVMTFSDFIVIWICSLRDFLAYKYHIYISGALFCKLHVFTFFLSCQFSSWLLTAANFDRLIYVISYQNSKAWCTRKTAIVVTGILFTLLVLLNGHFLLFVGSDNVAIGNLSTVNPFVYPLCTLSPGGYDTFFNNYYSWIDAFVFSFIPFIIMGICNAVLIFKVFSTKRNLKNRNAIVASNNNNNRRENKCKANNEDNESQAASRKVSFVTSRAESGGSITQLAGQNKRPSLFAKETSPFLTVNDRSTSTNCLSGQKAQQMARSGSCNETLSAENLKPPLNPSGSTFQQQISKPQQQQQNSDSSDRMRNLAITIIGVTLLFILFTVPINIYVPIVASSSHDNSDEKKCDDLIFCILNNMVNANHSINFFIYFITNSKFKREILLIFQTLKDCFTQSSLGSFLSFVTCGHLRSKKYDGVDSNTANTMKMREKRNADRAISGTSFAAEATFAHSRNNSQSQLDIQNQNASSRLQTTNSSNMTKSNSSYLSSSLPSERARNNSSPAAASSGKLSPAVHCKPPEINLIEVSENSGTDVLSPLSPKPNINKTSD